MIKNKLITYARRIILLSIALVAFAPSQATADELDTIEMDIKEVLWRPEPNDGYGAHFITIAYENITTTVTFQLVRYFGERGDDNGKIDLTDLTLEPDHVYPYQYMGEGTIYPDYNVITELVDYGGTPQLVSYTEVVPVDGEMTLIDIGWTGPDFEASISTSPPWGKVTYAIVYSLGSQGPIGSGPIEYIKSAPMVSPFIIPNAPVHDDEDSNWGFGEKWHLNYTLQTGASVRYRVYEDWPFDPASYAYKDKCPTTFTPEKEHYTNLWHPGENLPASAKIIRTLTGDPNDPNKSPDKTDLEGGLHTLTWDWRDDDGNLVEPGPYTFYMEIYDEFGNRRDTAIHPFVVKPPEIRRPYTSPINNNEPIGTIEFATNFNGNVIMLIGHPGTIFETASSAGTLTIPGYGELNYVAGDPIPTGPNPEDNIVRVINSALNAGENIITWDGLDNEENPLPNGLYKIALTAFNDRGDRIIGGMVQTTIGIDRVLFLPADEDAPELTFIKPYEGQNVNKPVTEIEFILTDVTRVSTEAVSIEIITPEYTILTHGNGGVLTSIGSAKNKKFTFTLDAPLTSETGDYQVSITAEDAWGNREIYQSTFKIFIQEYDAVIFDASWAYKDEDDDDLEADGNKLSWDAPLEFEGDIVYTIKRVFGYADAKTQGTEIAHLQNKIKYFDPFPTASPSNPTPDPRGTYSYWIQAEDAHGRIAEGVAVSSFIENQIEWTDLHGTKAGIGQQWRVNYSMLYQALVTATIYSSTTLRNDFTKDADGFWTAGASAQEINKLLDSKYTPAIPDQTQEELLLNSFIWNWDDKLGRLVPPGENYYLLLEIEHEGIKVDSVLHEFPVYNLDFTNLHGAPIYEIDMVGSVNFFLPGFAEVLVLFTEPDTVFTPATSAGTLTYLEGHEYAYQVGWPLPVGPSNPQSPAGERILRVKSEACKMGPNDIYWDATDEDNNFLPSNNYDIAAIAYNSYGYLSPIRTTTMSVDREIPTPHLHTLVVEDVGVQSLDEMSSFEYPVNKISFILESDYISIDTHTTSVTVTTPDSTYIEDGYLGVLTSTGPEKRTAFVFEFDSPLVEEGIYYVEITGYDIWGNFAKYNFSFSILPFPYLDTNLKLTVTWEMGDDIDTGGNILTWLAPQDLIGNLTYTIMRLTGYEVPGRTVEADGILLETFENADILEYHDMPLPPGSYTYLVRVEDRHGGLVEGKAVSRFFKSSDFSYTDEEKLTSGYNLLWNINYSIPYNAHVTATIFSSTTLMGDFSYDANGFLQLDPAGNAAEVKKLIDNELTTASRNEAEGHNTIRWDWDDESGRLVPPGEEYKIFFEIVHNGQLVDTYLANLPVYNLFIENLDAVDISPEELTSSIQFDLSGDAEILFLITKPDTLFINATSSGTLNYLNNYYYDYEVGQPIPVNPTDMTVAADRIVRVKKLSRAYGKAQMEWSGLDQAAKPVPNGNYKAALLVYNAFGYAAKREIITISVYRGITTPPENVPPMLYDLSPSSASKVAPRLHNISFKLTDESGIDHSQTSIVIEGPRNAPIVYTHDDGATLMYYNQTSTAAKYALIFDTHTRLETQGYYDTTINTADVWGNTITFSSSFLISTTTPRLVSIVPEDELRMIRGIKEIKFTLEDFEGGWIDIDKTVVTLRRGNEAQTFTVDDREHLFYNIQKNQVDFVLTFETELKPGNYIVEIHATDKWGYTNILQSGFVIEIEDLSLPQLTSIYPEDQEIIKKPLKTIEFTLSHKDGINASETSITVVSPIGEIFAPGLYANISSISRTPMERTFTLSLNESLEENGEYQVIIYAVTGSDEVVENEDGEEGEESRPVADSVTREFSTTFTLELPQSSAQFAKTVVAYPQPLTEGAATITYKIDEPSELRIEVYNLMQEKVFGQEFGLAVGEGTVQWNATDNKGKRVAPGIYFFRLIAENDENKMRAMKKIVIVR